MTPSFPIGDERPWGKREVDIRQFGGGASLSPARNAKAFQDAFEFLLKEPQQSKASGRGGKLKVPGGMGSFRIDRPIGFDVTVDFSCLVLLEGAGRRAAVIEQVDSSVPCFQLRTSAGNIRDFTAFNIQFRGGSVGVDLRRECYNLFLHCQFAGSKVAAIRAENDANVCGLFSHCWVVNTPGLSVQGIAGSVELHKTLFGESAGGFDLDGTELRLDGCQVHKCSTNQTPLLGEGKALFRVRSDSALVIHGGRYNPHDDVETFIVTDKARHVLIEGGDYLLGPGCTTFLANRYAHVGAKPYGPVVLRPLRVSSRHPTQPLHFYRQLATGSGHLTHSVENATIDCGATEYLESAGAPQLHADYLDASKNNTATLRPRIDRAA